MNTKPETNNSQQLNPVSQTARIKCQQAAKEAVIALAGNKPKRADYDNVTTSAYPTWVTTLVLVLCLLMLIAAFIPSAFRLFDVGSKTFQTSIDNNTKAQIAGYSVVLLAEIGAILFTLALSVLQANAGMRWVLNSAAVLSGAIAIVGNVSVAIFRHEVSTSVFVWLEALSPPLLTLATAYVLKGVTLNAIGQRHKDNLLYESALKEWERETGDPEKHPHYLQLLANELRDAIWKANRAKWAREYMGGLSSEEWSKLVWGELEKDNWYSSQTPTQRPPKREWGNSQRAQFPNSQLGLGNDDPNSPNTHPNGNGNLSGNYKVGASEQAELFFRENPDALYWKEHELVQAIGVSKGTVGAVRKRLLEELQSEELGNNE